MPARKESRAKRLERERLAKQHWRELHPKTPKEYIHTPTCSNCAYCVAKQVFLQRNQRAHCHDSMRWQWVCTHPFANNKQRRGNTLGNPQKVNSHWEMKPPFAFRPRWCPIMIEKDSRRVNYVQ